MKVITGSMIPAIDVGDIIIAKEPDIDSLRVGDIITFRIPGNILVTHRIVDIRQDGSFITKGDANLQEDTGIWVGESNIVGKYEFRIPGGASVIDSFKDYCGLILFFMLLSFIVPKMNIKQIISAFYSKTSM